MIWTRVVVNIMKGVLIFTMRQTRSGQASQNGCPRRSARPSRDRQESTRSFRTLINYAWMRPNADVYSPWDNNLLRRAVFDIRSATGPRSSQIWWRNTSIHSGSFTYSFELIISINYRDKLVMAKVQNCRLKILWSKFEKTASKLLVMAPMTLMNSDVTNRPLCPLVEYHRDSLLLHQA